MKKTMGVARPIPVVHFGKDHWSTFAYLETRIVDHLGMPDPKHMRKDGVEHPTRLKGGLEVSDHSDYDCAQDLVDAGFLLWNGTGVNPVFSLTKLGSEVANKLRTFKAKGGQFASFEP